MERIAGTIARLRGRSLAEARVRGAQMAAAWRERRGLSADARALDDAAFAARLERGVPADASALAAHWVSRTAPRFFAGLDDLDATVDALRRRRPARQAAIVTAADAALRGEFSWLGQRALAYGDPIDWHLDPLTGRRAPMEHWSRVPYLDASVVGDHKVVWEVNRHQFLVTLAQAWLLTGDERYARAVVTTIDRWIDANPPKRGINWASSLEVGFRAMSWLWALQLVRRSPSLEPRTLRRAFETLYLHGRHLETYLSTYFSPNTHLTGEALALFHLGVLLPELAAARRWRDLGWRVLLEQLDRQIHPDGVYFEQASYYQRYTADFYLHAFALADRNGIAVPPESRATLHGVVEHLRAIARPDGTLPLFGDDDGGRLTRLAGDDGRDVRATLGVAALVFDSVPFAAAARGELEEALWLYGAAAPDRLDALAARAQPRDGSAAFPVGGYYVLRGPRRDDDALVVSCGPHGTMNAGHAHADALSFELSLGGRPVVVDAGTFTYSGSERDRHRGADGHNAPLVDGLGSAEPLAGRAFAWRTQTDGRLRGWDAEAPVTFFRGAHDGFERLPDPVRVERTVLAGDGWFAIVDRVSAHAPHAVELPLHLAPGVRASEIAGGLLELADDEGPVARVALFARGAAAHLRADEGWVSSGYGVRERSSVLRALARFDAGGELVTLFAVPGADGSPARLVEHTSGDAWRVLVDRGDGVDSLLLAGEAEGVTVSGGVAWMHAPADGEPAGPFALFGAGRVAPDGIATLERECATGTLDASARRVVRRALTIHGSKDVRH